MAKQKHVAIVQRYYIEMIGDVSCFIILPVLENSSDSNIDECSSIYSGKFQVLCIDFCKDAIILDL